MAAGIILILVNLLLASVQVREGSAQCVSNCGCLNNNVCCLEVMEEQAAGRTVGRDDSSDTAAILADFNETVFTLNSEQVRGIFHVDQNRVISTLVTLDRENETYFEAGTHCIVVVVIVSERTDPSKRVPYVLNVRVTDINDNPPLFEDSSYELMIPETTATITCSPDLIRPLTASDMDNETNSMIEYSITGGNSSLFMIDDVTMPCVTNRGELDYDEGPRSYTFTLVASDPTDPSLSSKTTVTYIITDVNDNDPTFTPRDFEFSIPENLQPPALVGRLIANDIDSGNNGGTNLLYSIVGGSDFLTLDENSGNLTLSRSVDAERPPSDLTLTVQATDRGSPPRTGSATVMITIEDVNEYIDPPQFSPPSGERTIMENALAETIATITIIDRDDTMANRNTTIRVIGDHFNVTVFPGSMFLFLSQIAPVDYEQNTTVRVVLQTLEWGEPILSQTFFYDLNVMYVNDNEPSLNRTEFDFQETDGLRSSDRIIVDLSEYVFDADIGGEDGLIGSYELVSVMGGNFSGGLDESTGVLRSGDSVIDREKTESLEFTVNVTDRGSPPLSQILNFTVVITDVNDNAPMFDEPIYTFYLEENQPSGTHVGIVLARDPDYLENGTVVYSINSTLKFTIHERTGEIESKIQFDREIMDRYTFLVDARDDGPNSLSTLNRTEVVVIIDDIDDNDPTFVMNQQTHFSINTDAAPGSVVARVEANDSDSSKFNVIVYRIESTTSFFFIENDRSGEITLTQSLSTQGEHQLNISAFNPGKESGKDVITITITVLEAPFPSEIIAGTAGGATFVLLMIMVVVICMICLCHRTRRYKTKYKVTNPTVNTLNNQQSSILKIPTINSQQPKNRGVTFKESVQETHYDEECVVTDMDNTIRKESITKFDNSPRSRRFSDDEEGEAAGLSEHVRQPKDMMNVVDLEMSPTHLRNGDVPVNHSYMPHPHPHPHSPLVVHVMNGGRGEVVDYSQNTSSDGGHTYMDDEESMFSDDASIMNTALPRFGSECNDDMDTQYRTPPPPPPPPAHPQLLPGPAPRPQPGAAGRGQSPTAAAATAASSALLRLLPAQYGVRARPHLLTDVDASAESPDTPAHGKHRGRWRRHGWEWHWEAPARQHLQHAVHLQHTPPPRQPSSLTPQLPPAHAHRHGILLQLRHGGVQTPANRGAKLPPPPGHARRLPPEGHHGHSQIPHWVLRGLRRGLHLRVHRAGRGAGVHHGGGAWHHQPDRHHRLRRYRVVTFSARAAGEL